MNIHESITEARIIDLIQRRESSLENPGICIKCGEDADGCEPDARRYECECCQTRTVYAPEELLMAGYYNE